MKLRMAARKADSRITKQVMKLFPGELWYRAYRCITLAGDPVTVSLVVVVSILTGLYQENKVLVVVGAAIPIVLLIGLLIKIITVRARPVSPYSAKLRTSSFPSGHSTGSTIIFGLLAYFIFHNWSGVLGIVGVVLILAIPFFVGISRVRLGAHYPSDVLAGWILGVVGLIMIIYISGNI